jgi:hypothetical protein
MEKLTVKSSQRLLVIVLCVILTGICQAQTQSEKQQTFLEVYKHYPELSLPIKDMLSLKREGTIDAKLLNKLLFDLQDARAKHYVDDTLYKITSYGRINEEPFEYNTFKRVNGERIRYDTAFPINVYPLGKIDFSNGHVGLVTQVVGFMTDYIDIYLFEESTGKLKSLINAFEAAHVRHGYPEEGYEAIYNTSSITEEKQIKWHQERYSVTTDRVFDVSPDGYFRVIYQKSEGEFEY